MKRQTPKQLFAVGQNIRIDQGFGTFSEGRVVAFDSTKANQMGFKGNYTIELTGGVDCFGKPVAIGEITKVNAKNVVA